MQAWGHISAKNLELISKIQNKILRVIHNTNFRAPTKELYIQSKIFPVKQEIKLNYCNFAFDFIRGKLPSSFKNYFTPLGKNHTHDTRNTTKKLQVRQTNTIIYGSHSVKSQTVKYWNEISPKVACDCNLISRATFKDHVKSYLIILELA